MAYCTIDDIKGEFKNLSFSTTTEQGIALAEVEGFIDQASSMIDAQVSNCWVLPIEDITENLTTLNNLKTACVWLVADRLIPILQVKSRNQNVDQSGQDKITYYAKAKSLLNMLCPVSKTGVDSPVKKETSSDIDYFDDQDSYFERDTVQW